MPKHSPSRFTMVPLRKSSEPTATRRARTIMAAAAIAALTGPIALGVTLFGVDRTIDFSEVDPQGRGIADAAAFQMTSDEDVKIPTSKTFDPESVIPPREVQGTEAVQLPYKVDSVTWTGFERNTFAGDNKETVFEVHKYLLVPDVDEYIAAYEEENGGAKPGDEEGEEAPADDTEGGNTSGPTPSGSPSPDATDEPDPSDGGGDEEEEAPAEDGEEDMTDQEEIVENGVQPYQVEVPVVLTEDGPRLAGSPSIAPWTESEAAPSGQSDYSNYGNLRVDANSQTARQVGRWAMAYAANDEETLLDITGDSNSENRYVGLGGWQVADTNSSVQILQAISVNDGNQLLRVRVLLEDSRTEPEANENVYRTYADFDVLVSSPESATPQVVAWGAAGSGASLTPYSNAIPK